MLDATSKAVEGIIKASLKIDEWDELPMLIAVHEDGANHMIAFSNEADPVESLALSSLILLKAREESPIVGLVFLVEGWSLNARDGLDVEEARAELAAAGKRFSDHPAAIEIKMFTAIDVDGIKAYCIERGSGAVEVDASEAMSGRVPDALRVLMMEVTA